MTKDAGQIFQIPIPEMVRSFQRNDFWDSLGRPALLVNGCLEYHRPIITNACLAKQSQQSLCPKLVPILLRVTQVGNDNLPKI